MRPGDLEVRLVLFWIVVSTRWIADRRQGAKEINGKLAKTMKISGPRAFGVSTHHFHRFWINGICDHASIGGDEVDHFVQCCTLDFLPLEIRQRIELKIEHRATLLEFLYK